MRTLVLFAQKKEGTWLTLANPSNDPSMVKNLYRNLAKKNGGGYTKLLMLGTGGVERTFKTHLPKKQPTETKEGYVSSLVDLAAAVKIDKKELDHIRKENEATFPKKEAHGYEIAAVIAFVKDLGQVDKDV